MKSLSWLRSLIALVLASGAALAFAPDAHAAPVPTPSSFLVVEVARPVTGRVGEVITVNYTVTNTAKESISDRVIELRAAPNTDLVTGSGRDCVGRDPKRILVCKPNGVYRPGKTDESFTIRVNAPSGGPTGYGIVWIRRNTTGGSGPIERYLVTGTGGPSPTASRSPTRRATVSVPAVPTESVDESGAAPNVVEAEGSGGPETTQAAARESVGLATGMWIGVGTILIGLGLLATLLVMRRRDADAEPDQMSSP
jgi:hypothetical protein